MAHLHSIYDSDLHFKIDPITREITNQSANKVALMQFDNNSERFTFEIPQRYIEGHDMSLCDRVEVHYLNANAITKEQYSGVYEVEDLQISPNGEDVVICSWLVSRNATSIAGTLNFILRFACNENNYVWNTAIFKGITISNGLYNSKAIVEEYADVLEQWRLSLFEASAGGVANITEAKVAALGEIEATTGNQIAAIEKKKTEVLSSLPDDYISLSENVAPAIVESATGAAIGVSDSANRRLRGLTLYGKSTQDGTPTPEAPVEIVSVENPMVSVCGKNLVKPKIRTETINGVTFAVGNDGVITANGTATKATFFAVGSDFLLPPNGNYVLSGCPDGGAFDTYMLYLHYKDSGLDVYNRSGETPFTARNEKCSAVVVVYEGVAVSNLIFRPMVRSASFKNGEYEPYTEQALPISRSLPGIPVSSGGNYTDENGQQWICDEVDFERGVYVSRTKRFDLGSLKANTWYTWGVNHSTDGITGFYHYFDDAIMNAMVLSSIGQYSAKAWGGGGVGVGIGASTDGDYFIVSLPNEVLADTSTDAKAIESFLAFVAATPAVMLTALATPIETPLSAEELEAYASLRSNYPNTSVLNDKGAGMAVKYVADTKLYIDKKMEGLT